MSMARRIKCDVCNEEYTEFSFGEGFPGWAIIQGIAAHEPVHGESLTQDNMQCCLCPEHKELVSDFIDGLQKSKVRIIK